MLRVRVPATSANLGPGLDALGLALDLSLTVDLRASERDRFHYRGDGAIADTPHNLVHQGFRSVYQDLGLVAPPVALTVDNPIPLARGFGSSSAALVAGAALADALLDGPLGRDGVFRLTARLEGHPDNVAPAIYGDFTVSAADPSGVFTTARLPMPKGWLLLFGVPSFELPTAKARAVLPSTYSRSDAIRTSGRAALWAVAVATDRPELLRVAAVDVLHEPYRSPLVPGLAEAQQALRADGAFAAYLSGAGPTLAVVTDEHHRSSCTHILERFAGPTGRVLALAPGGGYAIERSEVA